MNAKKMDQLKSILERIQNGDQESIRDIYPILNDLNIKFRDNTWGISVLGVSDAYSISRILQSISNEKINPDDEKRIGELIKILSERILADVPSHHLRVFVSSPADVTDERALAFEVVEQIPYDPLLRGRISVEAVAWDKPGSNTPMLATLTPQEAINRGLPKPSECDIVVAIFWSRMGTPLGKEYIKPRQYRFSTQSTLGESRFYSGTEWELINALEGAALSGKPFVLVYRRMEEPHIGLKDPKIGEKLEQYQLVEEFFDAFSGEDRVIQRGYNQYSKPSDFRKQFEAHLKDLISQLLTERDERSVEITQEGLQRAAPELWKGSPFPGLRAFGLKDAPIFFGRGGDIDGLIEKVKNSNFIAIVSASGAGKSSLVGAGVLPRLQKNAISGSLGWPLLQFSPDELGAGDVFASLAAALQREPFKIRRATLANHLREHPGDLIELLKEYLPEPWSKVIIFVDQFEEIFTRIKPEDQKKFIEALVLLMNSNLAKIIVTLRADFYNRCLENKDLESLMKAGTYPIYAPKRDELREMIEHPAEQAGLYFEPGLVRRILDDTGDQPGSLALMAFALQQLYDLRGPGGELKHSAYDGFGGVSGAIGAQAQKAFDAMPPDLQGVLPRVFRSLIEISDDGIPTRARVEVEKITTDPFVEQLISELVQQRLLVVSKGVGNKPIVEVAHEALFTSWSKLAVWIREIGNDLAFGNRISKDAKEWNVSNKDLSFLLRGTRLEQAITWRKRAEQNLIVTKEQEEFINASVGEQERERQDELRRRYRGITTAAYVLAVVGLVVFIGWTIIGGYGQLFTRTRPLSFATAASNNYLEAIFGVNNNRSWMPVIQEFDGVPMALIPSGCFYQGYSSTLKTIAEETCLVDDEFNDNKCANINYSAVAGEEELVCFNEPFWLDVYEVTNEQYGVSGFYQGKNRPRDTMFYYEALQHCLSRDATIPTVNQWEYAGRGPSSYAFPWGNEFEEGSINWDQHSALLSGWGDQFQLDTLKKTLKLENTTQDINIFSQSWNVGSNQKDVSWAGVFDMAGNLKELTLDDRQGGESSASIKGGSFWSDSYMTILAHQEEVEATLPNVGFRCAKPFLITPDMLSAMMQTTPLLQASSSIHETIIDDNLSRSWRLQVEQATAIKLEFNADDADLSILMIGPDGDIVTRYKQKKGTLLLKNPPPGNYLLYVGSGVPTPFSVSYQPMNTPDISPILNGNTRVIDYDRAKTAPAEWVFQGNKGEIALIGVDGADYTLIAPNQEEGENKTFVTSSNISRPIILAESGFFTIKVINTQKYSLTFENLDSDVANKLNTGELVSGSLDYANHNDFWLLNAQEGDVLSVLLDTQGFKPHLRIYNSTGYVVKENFGNNNRQSILTLPISDTDLYILEVYQQEQAGGNYRLIAGQLEANPEKHIEIDSQINSTLNEGVPSAFWYFDGVAGATYAITLNSGDFAPNLGLYNSSGVFLSEDFVNNVEKSGIIHVMLSESGKYFVQVSNSNDAYGDYTLMIRRTDPYGDNYLAIGDEASGKLDDKQDQDYWYFKGLEGDILTISMITNEFDPYVYLLDPGQTLLMSTLKGTASGTPVLQYRIQTTGLYKIVTGTRSTGGTYNLRLDQLHGGPGTQIDLGETVSSTLGLNDGNDTDFWFFSGNAGEIISFSFESLEFHPVIKLFDPQNTAIYSYQETNEIFVKEVVFTEPYIFEHQTPLKKSGIYRLEIQGMEKVLTSGFYSLTIKQISEAGAIQPNTNVTGGLNKNTQSQVWSFNAAEGDLIFIQLDSETTNLYMNIFDSRGRLLPYSTNYPIRISESDVYRIQVNCDSSDSITEPYTLRVDKLVQSNDTVVPVDENISGNLLEGRPEVWFLDAQVGDIISINAYSDTFYPSMRLIGPGGQNISTNTNTPIMLMQSGRYLIQIYDNNRNGGSYALFVEALDPERKLRAGEALTSMLDKGGYEYWFFDALKGDVVSVGMQSTVLSPSMTLYSPTGQAINSFNDFPFLIKESGRYVVRASSQIAQAGSYSIKIEFKNDTISQGEIVTGTLDTANKSEFWFFEAQAGDWVSIRLSGSTMVPSATLFSPQAQNIASISSFSSLFLITSSGRQILQVYSYSIGSYTLGIDVIDQDNRLEFGVPITRTPEAGSFDYWFFETASEDIVSLKKEADASPPSVIIYSPLNQIIPVNLDSPFLLSQPGRYLLQVAHPPGGVAPYTLRVDTLEEDKKLTGGDVVTGLLQTDKPEFWSIEVQADEIVSASLQSKDNLISGSLLDAYGRVISSSIDTPVRLSQSGKYFVRLYYQGSDVVSYTLSINLEHSDTLENGRIIADKLESSQPDHWLFEAQAGDVVSIHMESEAFTPYMLLTDPNGLALGPVDSDMPILLVQSGRYKVQVSSILGNPGPYTILIDTSNRDNYIDLEKIIFHSLNAGKPDYWFFVAKAGDAIQIDVQSTTFTPTVTVFDPKGIRISTGGNSTISLLESGRYIIWIEGEGNQENLREYNLQVRHLPSDKIKKLLAGQIVTGNLSHNTFRQHWHFLGNAGDRILIDINSREVMNPKIFILDPSGNLFDDCRVHTGINNAVCFVTLPQSGVYSIVAGADRLHFEQSSYTLEVVRFSSEPSRSLLIGETITDTFGADNHYDYRFFEGRAGDLLRVTLETNASRSYVEVFDINRDNVVTSVGQSSPAILIPSTGTYILLTGNAEFSQTDGYSLGLKPITPDPIVLGKTIIGQLNPDYPYRYFNFEAQAGNILSITLNSRNFIPVVEFLGQETNGLNVTTPIQDGLNYIYKLSIDKSGQHVIQLKTLYLTSTSDFTLLVEQVKP